ncbi:hypothetical protein G5V58_01720 [Nocardioides anomalus]|uniref:Uncharacterized protein n=1 Tax=Nocardioides anomalus TaxID=2712223 RepID=A0A6G6W8X5_9ACTN|nr:hypothetical protein [Nocardioides anomalus]QIG41659.1 hypothetical protein G5V58_01720 [Nocardioides anomalus]
MRTRPARIAAALLALTLGFLVVTNPLVGEAAGRITGKQIKNGTITGKDVKNGGLAGADLRDDSVTGADVAESSLGVVPRAGDANTLAGRAASAYGTAATAYTLPSVNSPTTDRTFTFTGLGAGTYLVSYSVDLLLGSGAVRCIVVPAAGAPGVFAPSYALSMGVYGTAVGSGLVSVAAGAVPRLRCTGDAFSVFGGTGGGSAVTFLRVDSVTPGPPVG